MPIESTFQNLTAHCRKQCDHFSELQITIAEDRPLHGVVKLVDKLGELVGDALGDAEQALASAVEAEQFISESNDWRSLQKAVDSLSVCQTIVHQSQQRFFSELVCYSTIDDLIGFGRKRGGEWQVWTHLVRQSLDQCQQQLFNLQQAIFQCWQCWQEVAERAIPKTESPPIAKESGWGSKKIALIKDHRPQQRNAS